MLTVIIPSGGPAEKFFAPTIRDVLIKAAGEVEVYAITDGWVAPPEERVQDERVTYLELPPSQYNQKRHGINQAVSLCAGDYVMALDAHCLLAEGFDEVLVHDHEPNWVQIPRRHRLDAANWCLQEQYGKPPIDYEYWMWRPILAGEGLHGYKWDARTRERLDVLIDDTMTCQASTWFMTKAWYHARGFMQIEGYTGWGQEAEEICLSTWYAGGRVVTNKHTWYAHLHKGRTYGRMYTLNRQEARLSYAYSYNLWVRERREFFAALIDHFAPLPGWPSDWKEQLWKA